MALEIERKFLVAGDGWRAANGGTRHIVQAYLAVDGDVTVRVRIYDGRHARLTVKFGLSSMSRNEFEYPVPLADAEQMVAAAKGRLVEKTRHTITADGFVWEVDTFEGALAGLVVAEVEMQSEDDAPVLPDWVGREVTGDPTWSNAMLAMHGLPAEART